jgi:hypothetical protein
MSIIRISRYVTFAMGGLYLCFYLWSRVSNLSFDSVYQQNWYPWISSIGSTVLGVLPFPSLYLIGGCLLAWLFYGVYLLIRRQWQYGLETVLYSLLFTFCSFYVFWGFNYRLPAFVDRISLDVQQPTKEWITTQLQSQAQKMTLLRQEFILPEDVDHQQLQEELQSSINGYIDILNDEYELGDYSYQARTGMIVQDLPKGFLLRLETSGVYLSQTFQGHIDSGLSHVQMPFTTAHEMLHGYGITEESDCNLIAYLACRHSSNPWIAYSAEMAFFRYLAFDQITTDREAYYTFRSELPQDIVDDLNDINEKLRGYKPLFGPIKDKIYGAYLKSNGISDGMANYSFFVKVLYTMEEDG